MSLSSCGTDFESDTMLYSDRLHCLNSQIEVWRIPRFKRAHHVRFEAVSLQPIIADRFAMDS